MTKEEKIAAYRRAEDLSQIRHQFAHHDVSDGQELHGWKITIHQYEEPFTLGHLGWLATAKHDRYCEALYQTGSSEKEVRELIVSVIRHEVATAESYDSKPTPGWTLVGTGICILSGLSVLGVGYGVWLLVAPYVTGWWLG